MSGDDPDPFWTAYRAATPERREEYERGLQRANDEDREARTTVLARRRLAVRPLVARLEVLKSDAGRACDIEVTRAKQALAAAQRKAKEAIAIAQRERDAAISRANQDLLAARRASQSSIDTARRVLDQQLKTAQLDHAAATKPILAPFKEELAAISAKRDQAVAELRRSFVAGPPGSP